MTTPSTNIIIIGPVGAGKSTQGRLVATALGMQSLSLDSIANKYYEVSGFGPSEFQRVKNEESYLEAYRQWWPSLAYAAQKVVTDYEDCVIDFGAGHSHYDDESLFKNVDRALARCSKVVLLLPVADLNRSVSLLRQKSIEERKRDWIHDGYDFLEHWVKDYCNHRLATATVYTEGKTLEQTRDEIVKLVHG